MNPTKSNTSAVSIATAVSPLRGWLFGSTQFEVEPIRLIIHQIQQNQHPLSVYSACKLVPQNCILMGKCTTIVVYSYSYSVACFLL